MGGQDLNTARIIVGDAATELRTLPAQSVHCVITSPPYFGLRDYGTAQWEGGDPECKHTISNQVGDSMAENAISGGARPGADASRCRKCGAIRHDEQVGLERTPEAYVARLVEIFREVRRVLRDDGTCWLNLGDSYAGSWGNYKGANRGNGDQRERTVGTQVPNEAFDGREDERPATSDPSAFGCKPKDLIGIPWMVAFALRADGWWLRKDNIWSKPNPMPESVFDRTSSAHEYLFHLSKKPRYFYDYIAIREPLKESSLIRMTQSTIAEQAGSTRANGGSRADRPMKPPPAPLSAFGGQKGSSGDGEFSADRLKSGREWEPDTGGANKKSVWTIATEPFAEAHFAVMPKKLVEPCVLAGTPPQTCELCGAPWDRNVDVKSIDRTELPEDHPEYRPQKYEGKKNSDEQRPGEGRRYRVTQTLGWKQTCECEGSQGTGRATVLDPFAGAGTVGLVANRLGRDFLGIELNPKFAAMATNRIYNDAPLFAGAE